MKFPELNDSNFEQIIFDYFQKYNNKYDSLIGDENRCVFNKNSKKTITLAQLFVKNFSNKLLNQEENRGLLCWHSTGSGKTCLATGAMFSALSKNKRVVYLTSVDAIKANPPENFYDCSTNFFPELKKTLDKTKSKSKSNKKNMETVFKNNNIYFYSFAKLSHLLDLHKGIKKTKPDFLKDSLLIIDEIHQIFKPLPNQKKEHDALKEFLLNINNEQLENTKILILTATPGDNIKDVSMLLNMIRKKNAPEIKATNLSSQENIDAFSKQIRGLISYFDASLDYSKFPKLYELPIHTTFMSNISKENTKLNSKDKQQDKQDKQFLKYLEKNKEVKEADKDYNTLMSKNELNKYYRTLRKYSNMLFNYMNDMSLNEYSSKLPYVFEKVERYKDEKHYIYSAFFEARGFGQSIIGIGKLLKKHLDYKEFTLNQANQIKNIKELGKDKRFILIGTTDMSNKTAQQQSQELRKVKKLLEFYNDPLNANGEYIHILLASKKFNESIDLKSVRHIHIFEPLVSWIARKQTIGRAVRHCSHKDLEKNKWNVKLHEYISEKPFNITLFNEDFLQNEIDYIQKNISKQNKDIEDYTNKLKSNKTDKKTKKDLCNFKDYYRQRISRKKEILKKLQNKLSELNQLFNNKTLEMIDNKVYNTAKDKFKELSILDKVMKESAIDCLLFKDFHNRILNENERIVCKTFN